MQPTNRQLRYLRDLAQRTGTTFTPPKTKAEASREIQRLKTRPASSRADSARERAQVQDDLQRGRDDAVRHRPGETRGYGSSARWTHHTDTPETGR